MEAELTSGDKEIAKKQASQKGDLDELDAYMSDLKRDTTQDKIKRRAAKVEFFCSCIQFDSNFPHLISRHNF